MLICKGKSSFNKNIFSLFMEKRLLYVKNGKTKMFYEKIRSIILCNMFSSLPELIFCVCFLVFSSVNELVKWKKCLEIFIVVEVRLVISEVGIYLFD